MRRLEALKTKEPAPVTKSAHTKFQLWTAPTVMS